MEEEEVILALDVLSSLDCIVHKSHFTLPAIGYQSKYLQYFVGTQCVSELEEWTRHLTMDGGEYIEHHA